MLRDHALQIWQSAVDAARPETLIQQELGSITSTLLPMLSDAPRILVVGAGKAGSAMAHEVERLLRDSLDRVTGWVNVPENPPHQTQKISLHGARPVGSNQPTAEGVIGAEKILDLLSNAQSDDIALCLISGGGSALLPAPVEGITLEDKQFVTQIMHGCGATINEMNAVRKHLSRVKGGRLAQAFQGKALISLIISDVIGDPLDVIASGPTAADSSTFQDAWNVLEKYDLINQAPESVTRYLQSGIAGEVPETLKELPDNVDNHILGNNQRSLRRAEAKARQLGYHVLNLGSFIEGETKEIAIALAGIARSALSDQIPIKLPTCILSGGETTVTLGKDHGLGGRNQEFVLSAGHLLSRSVTRCPWVVLSGGTDGEDGPTDAAGAIADAETFRKAEEKKLSVQEYLARHDAYHFFEQTGDLIQSGLTHTNVMDVRVTLLCEPEGK